MKKLSFRGLRQLCQTSKDDLFKLLQSKHGFTIHNDGTDQRYAYRPATGSRQTVLGVAHADTVLASSHYVRSGDIVESPELDDRLGLWVLLYGLPQLNVKNYAIVVTDFEEVGRSTAQFFECDTMFNWIFQFDRRGTGVVNYSYSDNGVFDGLLEQCFGALHSGSFSDICYLAHHGVKAFNVGTAYYNEHTERCHANLTELTDQMQRFARFFRSFRSWTMTHADVSDDWYYFSPRKHRRSAKTSRKPQQSPGNTAHVGFRSIPADNPRDIDDLTWVEAACLESKCASCEQDFCDADLIDYNNEKICTRCWDDFLNYQDTVR